MKNIVKLKRKPKEGGAPEKEGGRKLSLPLRIDDSLSLCVVGLPVGLAGIPSAIFGTFAEALQEAAQ